MQKTALRFGLILLGLALVVGFFEMLEKRFAEGGLYPHYASFRSDPMGTSAFYETLEGLPRYQVSRNIEHLNSLSGLDAGTTILLLGYPREGFDSLRAPKDSAVMRAVEEGARLVITLNPELVPEVFKPDLSDEEDDWIDRRRAIREKRLREKRASDPDKRREEEEEIKEEEKKEEVAMEETLGPLLMSKIGFDFTTLEGFERPEAGWKTETSGTLPIRVPNWRSQFRFEIKDPSWKSVARVDDEPVVIERNFGKGSIVLATDSYFVSNESLHLGTEAEFLLWLLGGKSKIIFDETIHGSQESGGAMKLIRRYRAHGIFFGLFVFLILWAWRSASALVPGSDDQDRGIVSSGGTVRGEESGTGFLRLLRRSVPSTSLLGQCVEVWRNALSVAPSADTEKHLDEILQRHRRDSGRFNLPDAYGAIIELLRKH